MNFTSVQSYSSFHFFNPHANLLSGRPKSPFVRLARFLHSTDLTPLCYNPTVMWVCTNEVFVVNPAWGKKRVCTGCSVRFYDLRKPIPICPKCGTAVDINALDRSKNRALGGATGNELEGLEDLDYSGDASATDLEQTVLGEEDAFEDNLASFASSSADDI